jgi:hypothetical protein
LQVDFGAVMLVVATWSSAGLTSNSATRKAKCRAASLGGGVFRVGQVDGSAAAIQHPRRALHRTRRAALGA